MYSALSCVAAWQVVADYWLYNVIAACVAATNKGPLLNYYYDAASQIWLAIAACCYSRKSAVVTSLSVCPSIGHDRVLCKKSCTDPSAV